jgi:hypothetical protein
LDSSLDSDIVSTVFVLVVDVTYFEWQVCKMFSNNDDSDVFSDSPATYKEEDFIALKSRVEVFDIMHCIKIVVNLTCQWYVHILQILKYYNG